MPLTCNIDAKGKALRMVSGVVVSILGVALAVFWAWPAGEAWPWTLSLLTVAFGAFQIFEARAGWCVVRAMGFKTRI